MLMSHENKPESAAKAPGGTLKSGLKELKPYRFIMLTVAGIIRRRRGITLDGICPEACLPYGKVARYAGMLESDGFICTDLLQRCTINVKIV